MSRQWIRVLTSSAGVAMMAAWLVACGASPAPEPSPTSSETPAGHGALAQCLSEHGVPAVLGPAAGPPDGVDPETWRNAMKDCSALGPGPAG